MNLHSLRTKLPRFNKAKEYGSACITNGEALHVEASNAAAKQEKKNCCDLDG
jgi:hypothetical protein